MARACFDSSSIGSSVVDLFVSPPARISGMEQIGQLPGFGIRICGCIEQVQISAAGVAAMGLATAGGDCAPASGTKISRPTVKTAPATAFRKSRSKAIIEPRA
jgi:hypothetical protein